MRKNWEREIGGNQGNSAPVRPGMSSGQSVNASDKRAFMKVDGRDRRSSRTREERRAIITDSFLDKAITSPVR
jgi:hypothetical protein